MSEAAPQPKPWKVTFFTIWIGQAFSLLGSSLVQFALVWWLTKETGSATVLATATLVAMLPQIVISPIAGPLIDRWNRRLTMIAADSLVALATLGIAYLFWIDEAQVWHVYVVMLIRSMGGAFHWPAMQASTTLLVPPENFARVAGLNQSLHGAMSIVAPPLGALLLEALPMQSVLAVDIVTASIAITTLAMVHIPQPVRTLAPAAEGQKPSVMADFRDGLRYLRGQPGMLLVAGMATLINFMLNPAFSLMPLLVKDYFKLGAMELSWMESAVGIGIVAGGLLLSVWGGFKRKLMTSMTGMVGLGLGTVLIGLTPASVFALAVGAMFVVGVTNSLTNGPLFALMQTTVIPEMQGRVFTLLNAFATAASPLSLIVAGPLADQFGVRVWYVAAGLVCTLMGVYGLVNPVLRTVEETRPPEPGAGMPIEGVAPLTSSMD